MAAKTQKEINDEALAVQESQRKGQVEFDAKVHGAGTTPISEPQSVKEMFGWLKAEFAKLHARIDDVESRPQSPAPATMPESEGPVQ